MAEATAAAPSPSPTAAAAAVFFFLFSTTGPFQGHSLPLHGSKYFYFKFINFSISYFK
jgi:hypothetical protein